MGPCRITVSNIEGFRGTLAIQRGDLPYDMWSIFDVLQFGTGELFRIVSLVDVVSTKNELMDEEYVAGRKRDPRLTAFEWMKKAGEGLAKPRAPLRVREISNGFEILDGNATAQVLMLAGWTRVPVHLVR